MDKTLKEDLLRLVSSCEKYAARAKSESGEYGPSTRVCGFFVGTASGINFVIDGLKSILEDNENE